MKIALIQLNSTDDMAENIAKIEAFIKDAAGQGAALVCLPENCFLMRAPGKDCALYSEDKHPGVMAAGQWAKRFGVWVLVGSVAVQDSGFGIRDSGKTFNRSLLFNPEGKIVAQYDKIHLFDVELPNGEKYAESEKFLPGRELVVAKLPQAKLGMTICYDVRFPHLYRALAKAGAEIIAVPSAFTQTTGEAHWHVLLRARAIENGCYIIAPAQCGTHPGGRKTFGHSLVVDPWGKVLADGGTDEGVVMADIDLSMVSRVRVSLPSLLHDREFK